MINNYKQIFSREQIMTILKNSIKRGANSNKIKSVSAYGQKLRESKKISLFYGGLSKKYLQKINDKSLKEPSKLSENIFITLESRLDVVLYRSGFFESIKSAKQMVRVGGIKVNDKIVISPGYFVAPGDILSVFGKSNKKNLCMMHQSKALIDRCNTTMHHFRDEMIDRGSASMHNGGYKTKLCTIVHDKDQKDVNRKRLKKNGGISSKEKINFCKSFAKMKNKIPSRKAIVSRYKGSQMLLSTISLAFAYSRIIRAYKNNISDSVMLQSFPQMIWPFDLEKTKISNEKEVLQRGDSNTKQCKSTSTFFDRNKNRESLNIEKGNGFGLCLIFINTIKSLISHKDLRKTYNDEKLNRLETFNKDIPEKRLDLLFIFLNYLLNLKKQLSTLQKKKINYKKHRHVLFFKNQNLFEMKKTKVPHLEVSYKSLSIIFLFPPQRVNFPFFLNPSLIYK